MKKALFLSAVFATCGTIASAQPLPVASEQYEWSSVPIVGGGFVDGIICHPTVKDVRYCRTDMGGAYRWDAQKKEWIPILDWIPLSEANLQGVESIAIDPKQPNRIYMMCGTYTSQKGSVLRSDDGGQTYLRTDVPVAMGGNENGRGNGERLMIDPVNTDIVYMGTRQDGLWRTLNAGKNWERVVSFPDVSEKIDPSNRRAFWNRGSGIIAVVFDTNNATDKKCMNIYAAASIMGRESVFASHDGGETWNAVEGQPTNLRPTHMVLASDGNLYISYADSPGPSQMSDGAFWQYNTRNGKWQDLSPMKIPAGEKAGFGYAAVAVDAQNPKHIIVSTHSLGGKRGYTEDEIFRTTDGGKHWKEMFRHGYQYDHSLAPYTKTAPLHWMFDIEIDPFNPEHAMFTTGFGGWETFNMSDVEKKNAPIKWSILAKGIEETVPLEFYTPPTGARLLTGIGDYGGYTHYDITKPVPTGANNEPNFGNTDAVTGAWHKPELMMRAGVIFNHLQDVPPVSYSEDGGKTWKACSTVPVDKAEHGHVAMASDGSTWIWTPERQKAYYTTDKGATWTVCKGLPDNTRVIADKENPLRFYALDIRNKMLYSSIDGGRSFKGDTLNINLQQGHRGDNRGGQDRVYAVPGYEGDLWIAAYDGLYHTNINNLQLELKSQVRTIYAFGLGKAKEGSAYPTIYIIGVVNGQYGFFRSDDVAQSWVRINDDMHQYGLVLHIIGDWQEFGRVYVGTHGRGIITGKSRRL